MEKHNRNENQDFLIMTIFSLFFLCSLLSSYFVVSNICSLTNSRRFQVVSTKQSQTFYLDYYTVHKILIRRLHDAYRQFQWLCWQKAERWSIFSSLQRRHTQTFIEQEQLERTPQSSISQYVELWSLMILTLYIFHIPDMELNYD